MFRRLTDYGIVALHVIVLLAAVSVPCWAIFDALRSLLADAPPTSPTSVLDLARWAVLLGNTATVCGLAAVTALTVGLCYGLLIARTDLPGRTVLSVAAVLGACVPVHVSLVFAAAYIPISRLHASPVACGVLYGLFYSPLAAVVLGAAFRAVDRTLEEQALLDARRPRVLWQVTLLQAGWAFATLAMLIILLVATDFSVTDILGVRTFAEEVYTQFQLHRTRCGPLLTALPVFLALAAMLALLQRRYRFFGEQTPWQTSTPPLRLALGRLRPVAAALAFAVPAVLVGVPAAALLRRIGSLHTFIDETRALGDALAASTMSAAVSGTLVALLAVGLAWSLVRGGRWRRPVGAAVVLLLATPAPVVGISLIAILDRACWSVWGLDWPGAIYDSPLVLVITSVVRFLPVGVLLAMPGIQRVPIELEWAGRIDGCGWPALQRQVYWPVLLRPAAVTWLVVVILSFGEIGATVLVTPPGWETASVRAFTLIHFGVYADLAVLALLSVACIALPWAVLLQFLRSRR